MTRAQIQQVIVIVLLILFGVVWTTTRKNIAPHAPAPAAAASAPLSAAPASEARPSAPQGAGTGEEPPSLARDPFGPPAPLLRQIREKGKSHEQKPPAPSPTPSPTPAAPPPELSSLKLQGIFWGAGKPQVIINRKILSVGDTIEGFQVVAITKEGVTLTQGGVPMEIKPSAEIRGDQKDER